MEGASRGDGREKIPARPCACRQGWVLYAATHEVFLDAAGMMGSCRGGVAMRVQSERRGRGSGSSWTASANGSLPLANALRDWYD